MLKNVFLGGQGLDCLYMKVNDYCCSNYLSKIITCLYGYMYDVLITVWEELGYTIHHWILSHVILQLEHHHRWSQMMRFMCEYCVDLPPPIRITLSSLILIGLTLSHTHTHTHTHTHNMHAHRCIHTYTHINMFRCSEAKLGNYTFLTRIILKTICIRDFKSWSTG